MDTLLIFFFLGYILEKKKPVFPNQSGSPGPVNNLKWRAKFQIYRLRIRNSDWLNFIHFSGYKYKSRLVSILRKREKQALISILAILKFSALYSVDICVCKEPCIIDRTCYSIKVEHFSIMFMSCRGRSFPTDCTVITVRPNYLSFL